MKRLGSLLGTREPVLVTRRPGDTVRTAVTRMAKERTGIVAVLDDEELVGLFSERDLLVRVIARGLSIEDTLVGQVMTRRPLLTAHRDETIASAVEKMMSRSIRHLPILDENGRLIDMLSVRDLLRDQVAEYEIDLQHLHSYLRGGFDVGGELTA